MNETAYRLRSAHLGNERTIWVRSPKVSGSIEGLVIFLDAELYRERVGAIQVIEELESSSSIAPSLCAFISYESLAARWVECPCHHPFAHFIDEEFFPWLLERYPQAAHVRECVIVGLSYTGLAAAFVAMQAPTRFTRVIAQSGSFWSNDCWLVGQFQKMETPLKTRFYLDVGRLETAENVTHKEDVIQVVSQIEGVTRFRDALTSQGHEPKYVEFDGGHDCDAWRQTLPGALRWALPSLPSSENE